MREKNLVQKLLLPFHPRFFLLRKKMSRGYAIGADSVMLPLLTGPMFNTNAQLFVNSSTTLQHYKNVFGATKAVPEAASVMDRKLQSLQSNLSILNLTNKCSKETMADIYAKMGVLYLFKKNYKEAHERLKIAMDQFSQNYLYHYYMALLHAQSASSNQNAQKAVKLFLQNSIQRFVSAEATNNADEGWVINQEQGMNV
mgnify:CR=1 FL=1